MASCVVVPRAPVFLMLALHHFLTPQAAKICQDNQVKEERVLCFCSMLTIKQVYTRGTDRH